MPVFEYKGKTLAGAAVQGSLKAKSKGDLERVLRQNRILVTSISKRAPEISLRIGTGIKRIHVSRFTRQFATMIGAGLPMVQCLEILAAQSENRELARIINDVKEGVSGGATLSEAMARHPKIFDPLYTNMVEAGEVGGALDSILVRLAVYREKADKLIRKVKGAMVYPSVVMIVAIGVTTAMLTFIVPVFAKMFEGLGSELPAPTKIVLHISHFLQANFVFLTIGLIGLVAFILWWRKTPQGGLVWDKSMLRMPILGTLVRKSSVARFTRTLGTLLSSGVSILDAMDITARTAGNRVIANAINKSVMAIAEGDTITGPLKESGVFPPMVTQMISVGEKTGGLDEMLNKIAEFYDEEVDDAVSALTSIIEPVIIVFMGIVIGGILIAMYLPMFDIIGKIG
ncbi:MAG TPA: type II secretion system F family protein [candidate division Zixibacteria bacterium]|nr:type II secretion system F family protein [candidate division Zixibacteria bacterium]MDD4917097.1 type II secretion system F family protein [candidate division Zixibacteria bacterium]MDM7972719.1 type II secretion system F family protein [candidate division Zixibacteria bacterium]HOD65323.1 type II secretion system F family protein [candidate division Zixibacteria bacterium]HPM36196.1 type II secretion system F family protein [candidate division Zixibacteria bacterium]